MEGWKNLKQGKEEGRLDREENDLKEPFYAARPEYIEECCFIVIVEMLERLPRLKTRIKKYLETFPE